MSTYVRDGYGSMDRPLRTNMEKFGLQSHPRTYFDTLPIRAGSCIARILLHVFEYKDGQDQATPALLLLEVGGELAKHAACEFRHWVECFGAWSCEEDKRGHLLLNGKALEDPGVETNKLVKVMGSRLEKVSFLRGVTFSHTWFVKYYCKDLRELHIDTRFYMTSDPFSLKEVIRACPNLEVLMITEDATYRREIPIVLRDCIARIPSFKLKLFCFNGKIFDMVPIWEALARDTITHTVQIDVQVIDEVGCIWDKLDGDEFRELKQVKGDDIKLIVLRDGEQSAIQHCNRHHTSECLCNQ